MTNISRAIPVPSVNEKEISIAIEQLQQFEEYVSMWKIGRNHSNWFLSEKLDSAISQRDGVARLIESLHQRKIELIKPIVESTIKLKEVMKENQEIEAAPELAKINKMRETEEELMEEYEKSIGTGIASINEKNFLNTVREHDELILQIQSTKEELDLLELQIHNLADGSLLTKIESKRSLKRRFEKEISRIESDTLILEKEILKLQND